MGGTQLKEKYNEEHEVILNIILDKNCYYPGEILSGYLDLQPKYNINQTIFNDTQVIFKIAQFQQYSYTTGSGDDETTVYVREDSDVLTQETRLNYFCGANLLSPRLILDYSLFTSECFLIRPKVIGAPELLLITPIYS